MCADMLATFEETPNPAKLRMKYWGVASYLQTGSKLWNMLSTGFLIVLLVKISVGLVNLRGIKLGPGTLLA